MPAYWITPKSELVPVLLNHIQSVISCPSKFGYTKQKIVRTYKKYNEKIGTEGRAREEIIRDLVCKGWIRLRRYTNSYWSVTASKLTQNNKKALTNWASKMLKSGIHGIKEIDKYMPVKIVLVKDGREFSNLTILDVARGKLLAKPTKNK